MRTSFMLSCAIAVSACGGARATPVEENSQGATDVVRPAFVPDGCSLVAEEIDDVPMGDAANGYPVFLPRVTGPFTNDDRDALSVSAPHSVLLVHPRDSADKSCGSHLELVVDVSLRSGDGDVDEQFKNLHLVVTRIGDGLDMDGSVFFTAARPGGVWSGSFEEGWLVSRGPVNAGSSPDAGPRDGENASTEAGAGAAGLLSFWFPAK